LRLVILLDAEPLARIAPPEARLKKVLNWVVRHSLAAIQHHAGTEVSQTRLELQGILLRKTPLGRGRAIFRSVMSERWRGCQRASPVKNTSPK
jgi:hypothetical protein